MVSPSVLENDYRAFDKNDVERLRKTSILRKLGIGTNQIKTVLDDKTECTLQRLAVQKELNIQRDRAKKAILNKLSSGISYSEIDVELKAIEDSKTITEKLLESFPGYYGRFICLHFARFLDEPLVTDKQKAAYEKITFFLDNLPPLNLPEDLQDYLMEGTKHLGTEQITEMLENAQKSTENPDDFLLENKEALEQYLAFKQSNEYKDSPAFRMQALLMEFNRTSGYYDVFIPALKELSRSYSDYYKQLEIANEKLLVKYPKIEKMGNGVK